MEELHLYLFLEEISGGSSSRTKTVVPNRLNLLIHLLTYLVELLHYKFAVARACLSKLYRNCEKNPWINCLATEWDSLTGETFWQEPRTFSFSFFFFFKQTSTFRPFRKSNPSFKRSIVTPITGFFRIAIDQERFNFSSSRKNRKGSSRWLKCVM